MNSSPRSGPPQSLVVRGLEGGESFSVPDLTGQTRGSHAVVDIARPRQALKQAHATLDA